MASCRYDRRAALVTRCGVPKPSANSAAWSAGDVGGVMAAIDGTGGVLLNTAACGSLPCLKSSAAPILLGSSVSMPSA